MRATFVSFLTTLLIVFATVGAVSAATTDSLFEALRRDDPVAVAAAATHAVEVNTPDDSGATPLMHAVLYSRPAVVELLLDRGAAVNAANRFGSTALMWAAPRTTIVQLLLSRGADVNAAASDGTTPVVVAARVRNVDAMQAMVAAGADLTSPATRTNLLTIAYASPGSALRDYLASQHITLASARDLRGGVLARQSADARVVEHLLAAGVDPNEQVPLITLSLPVYFAAARIGRLETMRTLEKAGVVPTAKGARGWTALMLAASDDTPSAPVIRHLLAAGVDINAKDDDGRTALDWALTRGETTASELLRSAGGRASDPMPAPTRSAAPYRPTEAVARAIATLQPAGPAFSSRARCNSCHNQSLPSIAIHAARTSGVIVDQTLATHAFDVTQQNWRGRREMVLLGDTNTDGFQPNVAYGLFDMAETGAEPTPASDAMVLGLATRQASDGSWPSPFDIRPPLTASTIVSTALALRGLREFTPPGRRDEMAERASRAADFLRRAIPIDTQDQTFKLLGLVWAGAAAQEVARVRAAVIALQRADGGWGQLPSMASDAYATGQALFALHAAGVAVGEPVYRKGVDYLLRTQLEDGTWFVRTRAFGFQPYFETGFPYGRSQFISTAATAWAAAALARAAAPGVVDQDALLPGSPVGCTDGPHVSLRVALAIASPRAEPFAEIIRDEVTSIWHRQGVALQWIDVGSLRGDDDVLRLVVQDEEFAPGELDPTYTVGWIRFVGGRPLNVIHASRRTALAYVTRLVGRQTTGPMEGHLQIPQVRDAFARLLAWSLAHEIGHYVMATPGHTNTGLMRRAFVPEDLIGVREAAVALTPVETGRLKAWAAACRRADAHTPR